MIFYKCINFCRRQCKKEQEFQNKLEMYKILYQAYADEIKNLWQRSAFLGVFMTLAWGGYGALQLKFIDKILDKSFGLGTYHYYSILLCFVIIILSLLWIAMAKGSKFVQEAHEAHIHKFNAISALYCDLDKYEKGEYDTNSNTHEKNSYCPLKAYRFSPSKINIALGWISFLTAFALLEIHYVMIDANHWWIPIIFTIIPCFLLCALKGKPKNDENGGWKMKDFLKKHKDYFKCVIAFALLIAISILPFAFAFKCIIKDIKPSLCEMKNTTEQNVINNLNLQIIELNTSLNLMQSQLNVIEQKIQTRKTIHKVTKPKKTECPSVNFYCSPNVFQNPYLPLFMRYGVKGIDNELD